MDTVLALLFEYTRSIQTSTPELTASVTLQMRTLFVFTSNQAPDAQSQPLSVHLLQLAIVPNNPNTVSGYAILYKILYILIPTQQKLHASVRSVEALTPSATVGDRVLGGS